MTPFAHFWHPVTTAQMSFTCGFTIFCGGCVLLALVSLACIIERIQINREERERKEKSQYQRVGVR